MGHERQKSIMNFLRRNPGTNGADIARGIGLSSGKNIQNDITFLRKSGVIQREGIGSGARWKVIGDKEVPHLKKRGPKKGYHGHKNLCAYHRENARSGQLTCARCMQMPDASQDRRMEKLRKLFPRIFSVGGRS